MYQTNLVIAVMSEAYIALHQDGDTAMFLAKSGGHHEVVELIHKEYQKKGTILPYKVSMFRIHFHVLENFLYVCNDRSPLWAPGNEEELSPIFVSRTYVLCLQVEKL